MKAKDNNSSTKPTFAEAVRFWLKLGFISFGGPAGQIAIMHTELVEKKKWVEESAFLHALNFCMLLPGPEAQQLATYLGWRMHGLKGGIAAGALFFLPAALMLWALSWAYMALGELPWVSAIFYGLQIAVMAIVAAAVLRIGKKALRNAVMWSVAALAFIALFFLKVPFVFVILGAAILGWIGHKIAPKKFTIASGHGTSETETIIPESQPAGWKRAVVTVMVVGLIWWLPLLLVGLLMGWHSVWFQQGLFFSKSALVTFGGAYAVLPYVAQQAVDHYGWLSTPQMMSGLGLAETTPGPLIMVLQFVGFVGAWQHPGNLSPLLAGTLGAAVSTWATFLPSFLFIFTGAPFMERLQKIKALNAALSTITAAVVGVILNLAVWFGWHTLMPDGGKFDFFALIVALLLFAGMQRWKWGVIPVVAAGGLLGFLWSLI
ncbi:chromate efflux transporter [soil metagenome]